MNSPAYTGRATVPPAAAGRCPEIPALRGNSRLTAGQRPTSVGVPSIRWDSTTSSGCGSNPVYDSGGKRRSTDATHNALNSIEDRGRVRGKEAGLTYLSVSSSVEKKGRRECREYEERALRLPGALLIICVSVCVFN